MNDKEIKEKIENMKKNSKRKENWDPNDADLEANTPFSSAMETIGEINGTSVSKPKRICVQKRKEEKQKPKPNNDECKMTCIGNGKSDMSIDSAGNKFDSEHLVRNRYRKTFLDALTTGNIPFGAINPMPIAQRIEAKIYNEFKDNITAYRNQCVHCASNISNRENREIRVNLLMGRLEPEPFVFMSDADLDLQKMIGLRLRFKQREQELKELNRK